MRKLRRLLPQADALHSLFSRVLDVRRLLPQTDAEPVLARAVQQRLRQLLRSLLDLQSGRGQSNGQPDSRNEAHRVEAFDGGRGRGCAHFLPLMPSGMALPAASR
jgi:hypothetical protein